MRLDCETLLHKAGNPVHDGVNQRSERCILSRAAHERAAQAFRWQVLVPMNLMRRSHDGLAETERAARLSVAPMMDCSDK